MEHANNYNTHPTPLEPGQTLDIFTSTSLKDFEDKGILLQNIGYLRGIRVDNEGPQYLTRQVAKYVGDELPLVQEINDFLTETITTKTERKTNYVHHGWSIDAASTTSPWISSRIAARNQRNADGTWLTRRTLVQRFRVRVSLDDLAPVAEFEAEIEAALNKPTIFQQFEAVYRALHKWGDVVPLEVEMGASLVFTDLETNMSQEGVDYLVWDNSIWPTRIISPLHWRQTRIKEVVATTRLLSAQLQAQLSQLYAQRLSYTPVITRSDCTCRTHDDTPYASKNVSSVIVYAAGDIRSVTFLYADKSSSKHEGSETSGIRHEFVLTDGEDITEMLIWRGDWVYGVQFVTNFGRCSPNMGGSWNRPTAARSRGGVLVGVTSVIKQHEMGYLFRDIQGIWRHDIVDQVPKEDDVFSDYFGSKKGTPFNDRVIVRNSDMAISKIEVGAGCVIGSLQFTYVDNARQERNEYQTERHGGLGGDKGQFILEAGEHIIGISGKYNDEQISQMSFVTDRGQ
ncbi:unnamed protein product [Rhizoctonia solani]|uniref:Jacalin-type lectin domain-containing protein n=1 Tax=Rhizoctonia solani TaxID=456999 RepID=A0A8H3HR56_9AGAM|nr:unnamed protein product [Rhizoctonia solani]